MEVVMSIALIGASGRVGTRILQELSARGHAVTAIARHPESIPHLPKVIAKQGDVSDKLGLSALLKGHDIVISAVKFANSNPRLLIDAVKAAGVKRYLVVGGAGSLEVAPGVQLLQTPTFPGAYIDEAEKGAEFLSFLKSEQDLDWTFLSPSAEFVPGERTGQFRLGKDQLLTGDNGSRISFEDYAVAFVDEIERPANSRQRFTVGY
jgi:putative NADH-flavin reductase